MRVFVLSVMTTIFIMFIMSINIVSFLNLHGLELIQNLSNNKTISLFSIMFLFGTYIVVITSAKVPYHDYSDIEEYKEYIYEFKNEISNITEHIFKMALLTSILIAAMYYIK